MPLSLAKVFFQKISNVNSTLVDDNLETLFTKLENGETESHSKKKTKRMRTTFTEEQIQILQANFQVSLP